ncbi:glutamate binding protein [Coprinopsis marcescibilis]|uniref:Glutamate binding protein n=1 Tax=Coprinopsis marcescibilis TaxID=230819 RepID=A0A5C3KXL7_COPMA|nr:glutamate binding protein [Coprinopsis marcescibilis]
MSQYPVPPPSYTHQGNKSNYHSVDNPDREPLLGNASTSGGSGIYHQLAPGELPDDFKYGVSVSESDPSIRAAFIRKVYSILLAQIAATCVVGGIVSHSPSAVQWVQTHTWAFYVPLIGTIVNLGLLFWKRHSHPLNLILLSTFTLLEAFTLGVVVAFYDNALVLQALIITLGVFLGLTLFTFQSKYDFSGLGPFLFATLFALVITGFVSIFLPFNRTFDIIYAGIGVVLFSGYIVYDTYMINKRLSPDEYIMGAISLYLDFINLFINILRLMGDLQER